MLCHHLSPLGAKRLALKARSLCGHLHRKKAGSGWRGPSPKTRISCDLRHGARPDKVLPQGQTNQPLQLPSRIYRGKKEKKQNRREQPQRRWASHHQSAIPNQATGCRHSQREGKEPWHSPKHTTPESPKPCLVRQHLSFRAGRQEVRLPLPRTRWAGNIGFREQPLPRKR